jgi:lipopolysaccharide assembly outer membrane protein LptD (OstA)
VSLAARTAAWAALVLLGAATARPARAQVAGEAGRARVERAQSRSDSAKLRAGRDTASRVRTLIRWEPADSVALELMNRKGYSVVRYQANDVQFGATDRTIVLAGVKGARAGVERESTVMVADTIEYSDSAAIVNARGDTITLRDPTRNDDLTSHDGYIRYDLKRRTGTGTNVATSTKSGETWYVAAHRFGYAGDTTGTQGSAFYGKSGSITSCDDSIPHYHFLAGELKRVAGSVLVARPAILYIMDVPVMWMPFIFQDAREGRRTGILTPRFGITELVRNSPTYRRTVENVGYYFALSDYVDAATSLDWRSSAKSTTQDPGWVRLNAEMRYRWLDRFVSGRFAVSQHNLSNGNGNTAISWSHQQDFSIRSHLTASLNYVTSTTVQRQTLISPLAAVATIASQLNYQREMGNVSLSLGGIRRQYPGRPQIDQDFPSLNITSKPLTLANWLLWTPTFSFSSSQSQHLDSQGDFANRFFTRADGTLDSAKVDKSTRTTQLQFTTPFKLWDFQVAASVRASDRENDFPEIRTIVNPADTSKKFNRVFARTYLSTVDFDLGVNLPQFFQGSWNLVPSVTMGNVDPSGFLVRSERTGSRWVSQSKRLSYALSVSPTFFGLTQWGVGPIARFRHSVTTGFSYSYSPASSVSDDFLAALGKTPSGYLGSFAQNRVTLSLATNVEAKLRATADSAANNEGGRKIKMLSLTFTPLTWDFERQKHSKGGSGFASDQFGYTLRSDMLPGLDFGADYSLFQGSVLSDTAKFSPFLQSIRASFSLNAQSAVVKYFGRLFGADVDAKTGGTESASGGGALAGSRLGGTQGVAGQAIRNSVQELPTGRGFDASISFSRNRQRPPVGGRVIQYDPTIQCAPYKDLNPIQYDICVRNALAAPPQDISSTQTTGGGSFIQYPPQTNIMARTSFNLTPKWSASWSTNYDVERSQFGSQSVTLQRDLHDWRAVFGFSQAPNGAFSFTFFIALKAEPDIKFNYDRSSFGSRAGTGISQ